MKPRVYVETSVVSHLTAAPSRDIVTAGRLQVTREWWATAGRRFALVTSELVREEAAAGNGDAAWARLAAISAPPTVAVSTEVARLAQALVDAGVVPRGSAQDGAHIAIAAMRRVPFS